jgi:hypothetical protein
VIDDVREALNKYEALPEQYKVAETRTELFGLVRLLSLLVSLLNLTFLVSARITSSSFRLRYFLLQLADALDLSLEHVDPKDEEKRKDIEEQIAGAAELRRKVEYPAYDELVWEGTKSPVWTDESEESGEDSDDRYPGPYDRMFGW